MLIVDDEPKILQCLTKFFGAHDFSVVSETTGEAAISRLKIDRPDVMLLDVRLPGMSGLEVLKRAKELHPNARVIMVSAVERPDVQSEAKAYGADGFVTKPFDFSTGTWAPVLSPEE